MRALATIFLVVVIGVIIFFAIQTKAPESVPSAKVGEEATTTTAVATSSPIVGGDAESNKLGGIDSFTFTGYGPGKSETGTFKETSVTGVRLDDNGFPVAGKFTIKTASVSTGKDGLDKHLCSEDFFDCVRNTEIVFDLKSVKPKNATPAADGSQEFTVAGDLTFNGKTLPFEFVAIQNGPKISADFKFDTTFFNFKYVGIDKEVRIEFTGHANLPAGVGTGANDIKPALLQ